MKTVQIGTFNIQHGKDHKSFLETRSETIDLALSASVIRAEALDVCVLNEVRNQENVEGLCNQAKVIGESLGFHWYFARAIDHKGGEYGNAIVSRYPITSVRTYPIAIPKEARIGGHYYEDRVLFAADISVDGEPLTVFGSHFGLAPDEQLLAVETVKKALAEAEHPVVLLGDFNVTPASDVYALLLQDFTDAADTADDYFTFPSHAPRLKIDYIFTSARAHATDFAVCPEVASDHRAIKAVVTF